jgi:hypothetical protein
MEISTCTNECFEWGFYLLYKNYERVIGTTTKSYEGCTYLKGNIYHMPLWIFKGGFVVKIGIWYQCLLLGRIVLIEIESFWFCDLNNSMKKTQ